jgi:hypothetical protein
MQNEEKNRLSVYQQQEATESPERRETLVNMRLDLGNRDREVPVEVLLDSATELE